MEKIYIICGSIIIPLVMVAAMAVTKLVLMKKERAAKQSIEEGSKLIEVLKTLVRVKNDHIKQLKL